MMQKRYPEDWLSGPRLDLYRVVSGQVGELQRKRTNEMVRDPAVAMRLARLRRAVNVQPGSTPEVWADTIGVLPEEMWGSDVGPSGWEVAAHTAITLFAVHIQGSGAAVHDRGSSLGSAVRRLAGTRSGDHADPDSAVLKRFQALATATATAELNYHLRSMINLLRSSPTQLDYGLLAVDVHDLLEARTADRVRLRWARDYHRVPADIDNASAQTPDQTESRKASE